MNQHISLPLSTTVKNRIAFSIGSILLAISAVGCTTAAIAPHETRSPAIHLPGVLDRSAHDWIQAMPSYSAGLGSSKG